MQFSQYFSLSKTVPCTKPQRGILRAVGGTVQGVLIQFTKGSLTPCKYALQRVPIEGVPLFLGQLGVLPTPHVIFQKYEYLTPHFLITPTCIPTKFPRRVQQTYTIKHVIVLTEHQAGKHHEGPRALRQCQWILTFTAKRSPASKEKQLQIVHVICGIGLYS